MEEKKIDFRLGKLQKEILKTVCDKWTDKPVPANAKTLSWDIARKFNTENNRIKMGLKGKEVLTKKHTTTMSRSLKLLRERDLIEGKNFALILGEKFKGFIALSDEGKNWCEIHIKGFKETREKMLQTPERRRGKLFEQEEIKN